MIITQAKSQGFVSRHDIIAIDANKNETQFLAELNCVVAVLQDLDASLGVDLAELALPTK